MRKNDKKVNAVEFVKWFGPLLDALRELGGSAKPRDVADQIARTLRLSDSVLEETIKSGILKYYNQVHWARQYLVWEGLLDNSERGTWRLTKAGQEKHLNYQEAAAIASKWSKIYRETKIKNKKDEPKSEENKKDDSQLFESDSIILLDVLQQVTPKGFEVLCKRLLREHGFTNLEVTGNSHDGGIDGYGILELNPFVSMKVLFQCKRYKGTVSRAQVGDFRNAMIGRAEKGLIITTGIFSEDAKREASRDGAPPIELIDGKRLVELFEAVELGVKPRTVYDVEMNFFEPYLLYKK